MIIKPTHTLFKRISLVFLFALVLATFVTVVIASADVKEASLACGTFPVNAGDAAELTEAIDCFNAETAAGAYEINLTADIPLTASLVAIDNSSAGVMLNLNGNGFKIDGQNITGTRPIAIYTDTVATLKDIVITGGFIDAIDGALRPEMSGGGIVSYGDLTLENSQVISNVAEYWGGGIFSESSAKLTIIDSKIANNRAAREDGGGLQNFGTLILDNSVVEGNIAQRFSGGIGISVGSSSVKITISNSSILNNVSQQGAGIYNRNAHTLISNSIISGNVASAEGGGIFNNRAGALLTITHSTISDNSAVNAGGGLHNNIQADLVILNSTISNNSTNGSTDSGAALFNASASKVALQNSTISGNTGDYALANRGTIGIVHTTIVSNSSGIGFKNLTATVPSQVVMANSVIANHAVDCSNDETGALLVNTNNLIETDAAGAESCASGSTLNGDPELMPLGDNGSNTFTHLPSDTSPLLNAADTAACDAMIGGSIDQRGLPRPSDSCDIGSVELIAGITVNNVTVTGVNSGSVNAVFTLTRDDTDDAMSVIVNTADGTATAGEDYTPVVSQTVSFAANGAASKTVSVAILGDNEFEGDETFKLLLSDAVNVAIIDKEGIGTIKENKTIKLTLSAPASVVEQDSGTSDYEFTFTLESATAAPFDLTYTTQDGTAMVGDADYEFRTGTLNFSGDAGSAGAESFTVKVSGDTKSEADETFSVLVTAISDPDVGVTPASLEAVIKNDDEPIVSLAAATYSALEDDGSVVVRVELSSQYSETITVDVKTADGTALAGSDYTAVDQTLSFAAGETAKDVTISIADNESGEDDETFTVALSNITGGAPGTVVTATVTIAGDGESLIYLPLINR
ncbi:MAG: Calx-beta domain-containing protein [Anaerolineae bacterium]